jgi:DNA-binding MarR family transcriptional regulator
MERQSGLAPDGYNLSPSILVVSDTQTGAAQAAALVEAIGARVSLTAGPGDDLTEMAPPRVDALFANLRGEPGVEATLDGIEALARDRAVPAAVSVPLELIDLAMARITHPSVTILCDAPSLETAASLTLALGESAPILRDASTELESIRLRRLADEVARIAKALSNLSSTSDAPSPFKSGVSDVMASFKPEPRDEDDEQAESLTAAELRAIIRQRRLRERFFDAQLFADPAWDMLLDLMAAQLEHVQVAVSSLCIAAAVPPTTALRWIKSMTDEGLFERVADPDDGRRIFIRLSDQATHAMQRYFRAVAALPGRMI